MPPADTSTRGVCAWQLPAALPMPFSAPGRADPLLLHPPTISAAELPTHCKPWRKALQDGVAAAMAHDHDLFEHIRDAHDPDSLRRDHTDSPLVSPWIAQCPSPVTEPRPDRRLSADADPLAIAMARRMRRNGVGSHCPESAERLAARRVLG